MINWYVVASPILIVAAWSIWLFGFKRIDRAEKYSTVFVPVENDWREERRERRRVERADWNTAYLRALPPEPPCESQEHDHTIVRTAAGEYVVRICEKEKA